MHRFYIPPEQCAGPDLLLTGDEAHHAQHVLRVHRGEEVVILNGAGGVFHCLIQEMERHAIRLAVTQRSQAPPPPRRITLIQALPRGKLIESIIQKAAELGVSQVIPLLSERVVSKIEKAEAPSKKQKWQAVAVEAIKQCGAPWLPKIELPSSLAEVLDHYERSELTLVGSLRKDAQHARQYFDEFRDRHGRNPSSLAAWVGPEGDFTSAELDAIERSGARPITLGPLVLRSETAAIYCLSIMNYEVQASGTA
jgi:16S rRNA (uracil1498-N3)-methyltransferase